MGWEGDKAEVLTELNYDERGWPQSISEEVKYTIADDITHYVNKHFKHYKMIVKNGRKRMG